MNRPEADPHDGWCGRGELIAPLDPIRRRVDVLLLCQLNKPLKWLLSMTVQVDKFLHGQHQK